ncbi:MAG: GntR family transcriptional regulator [Flavobacteriaceae bacterium]|nr:GntR family transcriptional regulator [Flavobacteriaceae bacterium]
MELGKINTLIIDRNTSPGLYLVDKDNNDVLLPGKYIPKQYEIGDAIEVFVYLDNEERKIATTLKPYIQIYEFGWLEIRQITKHGAFADIGIEKDLFIPFKEQARPMQAGKRYLIYMFLDEKTDRLVGTSKINRFLSNDELTVAIFEEVDIMVSHMTDMGINVIINGKHKGMVYENEVYQDLRVGDKLKGIVKKIRSDKKIDVSLQQLGYRNIEPNAAKILQMLEDNNGYLLLTDKSNPETIKEVLQMSKKSFKKAIGTLYKQRKVELKEDGVYLK